MILRINRTVIAMGTVAGIFAIIWLCGFFNARSEPAKVVRIPIGPSRVAPRIALGWASIYVLAADGTLWGLGQNQANLWTGLATQPRQIGSDADWQAVVAGAGFAAALKTNGTLWQWGYVGTNRTGQVGSESNWVEIAAGSSHLVALRKDGSLWAWGQNNDGQLGCGTNGPFANYPDPMQVGSNTNWIAVAAGAMHSLALRRDGSLWVWGRDRLDKLRRGPVRVGTETNWVTIGAGDYYSMAIKRDGTCWGWGNNDLLESTNVGPKTRGHTAFFSSAMWVRVMGGQTHNLALGKDGSAWGGGGNLIGAVGNGTTNRSDRAVRIDGRDDWIAMGAASSASAGLSADGTLWGWGEHHWEAPRSTWTYRISRLLSGVGIRVNWGWQYATTYSAAPAPIAQFCPATANR